MLLAQNLDYNCLGQSQGLIQQRHHNQEFILAQNATINQPRFAASTPALENQQDIYNDQRFTDFRISEPTGQIQPRVTIQIPSHIDPRNLILMQNGRIIEPICVLPESVNMIETCKNTDQMTNRNFQSSLSSSTNTIPTVDINEGMNLMNLQKNPLPPQRWISNQPFYDQQNMSATNFSNFSPNYCSPTSENLQQFLTMTEQHFNDRPFNDINDVSGFCTRIPIGCFPHISSKIKLKFFVRFFRYYFSHHIHNR